MTAAACHRLLDVAAQDALAPLGLARLDATTWVDDHGWWIVAADFETLGAKGTRLVIYADFLWHVRERPARTIAARVRERGRLLDQDGPELVCDYESETQFAPLATGLAARAATEVHAWREGFPTMRAWAGYLDGAAEEGGLWREYDAAVAAALAGDDDRARHWFDRVFDHPVRPEMYPDLDQDDVVEAQRIASGLTATLGNGDAFRDAIGERVAARGGVPTTAPRTRRARAQPEAPRRARRRLAGVVDVGDVPAVEAVPLTRPAPRARRTAGRASSAGRRTARCAPATAG